MNFCSKNSPMSGLHEKRMHFFKCRSKAITRISATAPFSQAEALFLLGDLVENSTYCNFRRMLFFNTMDFSHQSKQRFPRFPLPTLPPPTNKKMTQISTIRMESGHSGQALSVLVFFLGIGSVLFSSAPGKIAFFRWRNLGAILLGSCWHQTPPENLKIVGFYKNCAFRNGRLFTNQGVTIAFTKKGSVDSCGTSFVLRPLCSDMVLFGSTWHGMGQQKADNFVRVSWGY